SLELTRFPLFHRTRRRLCTLKPASATYGAKLLLRKVSQYMGHSAVCQVGRHKFFTTIKSGLNRPIGRQTNLGLSPLRGWMDVFDRIRWFLHWLISAALPSQRVIPDFCRNFSLILKVFYGGLYRVNRHWRIH